MSYLKSPSDRFHNRAVTLFLSCVIISSIVGYFVGIGAEGNKTVVQVGSSLTSPVDQLTQPSTHAVSDVLPATKYTEMRRRETGPTANWIASLSMIPQPAYDSWTTIKPAEEDKLKSLRERALLRAFNGAPPIVPHAVEQTTDAACHACHGQGLRIEQRVARRMSHGFLTNCTQCHALPPPKPFEADDKLVENDFIGAMAPVFGKRAFPGAPPVIPHSTWMRGECLACHGVATGWGGMESTHPWRSACQQCHAPSAVLDQAIVSSESDFLPSMKMSLN